MIGRSLVGSLSVIGVGAMLTGCLGSGAEWTGAQVTPGYQAAKPLTVTVVKSATTGDDLDEAVNAFVSSLRSELKEDGVDAAVALGSPGGQGAEVDIKEWDPGSRALRYFISFGSGMGHVTVVVNVPGADGTSALKGQVRGVVKGGMWGGASTNAADAAAKAIAKAIATGKPEDD
jgi:Domain of unknown function (DUF4410)